MEEIKKRKNEESSDDEDEIKKSKIDITEVDEEEALRWLQNQGVKEILNEKIFEDDWIEEGNKKFNNSNPFPHILIENFFKDDIFLEKILEEITQEELTFRSNDLYDFHQTDDLKNCKRPLINKMKEILYGEELRERLGKLCGIELYKYTEEVSMSAAIYERSHKLLCHDDQLEGRRIAYVIYLVDKDWEESDGGTLDFFESEDGIFASTKIGHSLVPRWNSIILFEVSQKSFHQVSEVLSDRSRVSISGWFHGSPVKREKRPEDLPLKISPFIQSDDGLQLLKEWLNPSYLVPNKKLQQNFSEESSLQLRKFLNENMYTKLYDEINKKDDKLNWELEGPPNKRFFFHLKESESILINSFTKLLKSESFAKLLNEITSMEMTGVCSTVKKYSHKCYSLLHDDNVESQNEALDVIFCCVNRNWCENFGGEIHYVAPSDENELMNLPPLSNTLNLVYRSPGDSVMSFVKYVNQYCNENSVYYFESVFRVK